LQQVRQALQPEQELRASELLVPGPGQQALLRPESAEPERQGPVQEQPVLQQRALRQGPERVQRASGPERREPLVPEQVRQASEQLEPGRPVLRQPEQPALQPGISNPV